MYFFQGNIFFHYILEQLPYKDIHFIVYILIVNFFMYEKINIQYAPAFFNRIDRRIFMRWIRLC